MTIIKKLMDPKVFDLQTHSRIVELSRKNKDFKACCVGCEELDDNPWSLNGNEFPASLPNDARFLGEVLWLWGPGNNRYDTYYLSSNAQQSHWFLWVTYVDEDSSQKEHMIYAYTLRNEKDDAKTIAILLLIHAWQVEKVEYELELPHCINRSGELSDTELQSAAKQVWGSTPSR